MSTLRQFSNGIKSIQRGTITLSSSTSGTATISSVDTTKANLEWLGDTTDQTAQSNSYRTRLTLTDATTVTANRVGATGTGYCYYQVTEFY